jgi:signal transduction histidine kinase
MMRAARSDVYIDGRGRRYKRMSFEQRVQLRKTYIANVPRWRHPVLGYIVAIPFVALATLGTWYLTQLLGHLVFTSILFIMAMVITALLWGVGPALFALLLSAVVLDYFYIQPSGQLNFENGIAMAQLAPFIVCGLIISLITAQRERARLQALAVEQELQSYAEELEESNRKLQDANQMKDHFLSIASHELKTPVTTIRGQAQLVLRRIAKQKHASTADMDGITAALERINDQTGRLTMLIEELLDVSSMRAGKAALNRRHCDLRALCAETVEDQRLLSGRQIVLDMPAEAIDISIDYDRMAQVLTNLISNAAKYSPEKKPIEVKLSRKPGAALLSVTDHGRGIEKDQLERIFETFYRTPEAQSSSKRGLGLGLAISKDIIERHSGRIWCESVVGQGSTFFVELPLEAAT